MSNLLPNNTLRLIQKNIDSVRETVAVNPVYLVSREDGDPEDPLFGEPIDPFAGPTNPTVETLHRLQASVTDGASRTNYNEAGFHDKHNIRIDIDLRSSLDYELTVGSLLLYEGSYYRATSVDKRGLSVNHRVIVFAEEVT